MPDLNVLAVVVAGVAAFALSGAYYAIVGGRLGGANQAAASDSSMPPWKLAVELLRSLMVATVIAGLAARGDITEWPGGLLLGLALWVGFPVVLWTGAIIHDNTPMASAALHGGDWLVKLLVIGAIIGSWP